jgi:hypothetical protein
MPKIFESPDGGRTIFSREAGSLDRTLEWEDEEITSAGKILQERRYWEEILNAAKDNSTLHDAIERVKLIYHLSKKDEQK